MGAQLCGLRRSRREEEDQPGELSNLSQFSLAELLLSPPCSGDERKSKRALSSNHSMDQIVANVRMLTLEEWMIASPARLKSHNGTTGSGELTRRVLPASPVVHHAEATELDSGEGGQSCPTDIFPETGNDVPTSSCGKAKKRVSFRSPREADIILLYSPAREIQDIQGSTIFNLHATLALSPTHKASPFCDQITS